MDNFNRGGSRGGRGFSGGRGNNGNQGRGWGQGMSQRGRGGANAPQGHWAQENQQQRPRMEQREQLQGIWAERGQSRGGRGGSSQPQGGRGGPYQPQGGRGGPNQPQGGRGGPYQPQGGRGGPNQPQGGRGPNQPQGGRGGPNWPQGGRGPNQPQGGRGVHPHQSQNRGPGAIPKQPMQQRPAGPGQMAEGMQKMSIDESRTAGRGSVRGKKQVQNDVMSTKPDTIGETTGTNGNVCQLVSNHVDVEVSFKGKLFQYTIIKEPQEMDTYTAKKIVYSQEKMLGAEILVDGGNVFSVTKLKLTELSGTHTDQSGKSFEYKLTFNQNKNKIDLCSKEYFQLLNLLFKKAQGLMAMRVLGKHFFDVGKHTTFSINRQDKRLNFRQYDGMAPSIRCHENDRFLLNLDPIVKITRGDTILDMVKSHLIRWDDVCGRNLMTPYASHNTYTVIDVLHDSSVDDTFNKQGKQVSYRNYMRERYNLRVTDNRQPMLLCTPKGKRRIDGQINEVNLIPEFCYFSGVTVEERKADFLISKELIARSSQMPGDRMDRFQKLLKSIRNNQKVQELFGKWQLKFGDTPVNLKGRVLPQPEYVDRKTSRDVPSAPGNMVKIPPIGNWLLLVAPNTQERWDDITQKYFRAGRCVKQYLEFGPGRGRARRLAGYENLDYSDYDFVVCVINTDENYAPMKSFFVKNGIQSQFILQKSGRKQNTVMPRVALQIACKLGGDGWLLREGLPKNTMVVGYDVCHEGPKTSKFQSFGATVCTYNNTFSQYFSKVQSFAEYTEVTDQLSNNVRDGVIYYKKQNGKYPERVLVFRDGVGEGQLDHVYNQEVKQLKKMLTALDESMKLVFIIVTKRLGAKLFSCQGGRYENPRIGTVVDSVITFAERYDFYLVNQNVRTGTANPTNYNVIHDDTGTKPDILQKFAYHMSYMYYNWGGPITVPSPCMYAHKLAAMAGTIGASVHSRLQGTLWFL